MSGKTVSARISQKTCHLPLVICVCGTTDTEIQYSFMLLRGNSAALPCVVAMLLFLCGITVQAQTVRLDSVYQINEIVVDGHREVSAIQVFGFVQLQALPSSPVPDASIYLSVV